MYAAAPGEAAAHWCGTAEPAAADGAADAPPPPRPPPAEAPPPKRPRVEEAPKENAQPGPRLCCHLLEGDGGSFGCQLPAGHQGAHESLPSGRRSSVVSSS